jgi:hypothetical protein
VLPWLRARDYRVVTLTELARLEETVRSEKMLRNGTTR